MKPISYQGMPSSVNGGRPILDHVSSPSSLMRCEKCGYASTDSAVFKKHMLEHMGTRFYCFYCNSFSSTEAELNTHLKQHTANYPYKCPHCGQGYMRKLCLVKHIERLHGKAVSYGPVKAVDPKIPHVPVSSALPNLPTADPTAFRPLVRVSVPTSSAPAFRLAKNEQRGKPLDANASNVNKGNGELLSPLNGLIQHNRALTVSLPDEVSIPAGCLVELVEVKTVNGTKELKLRLVSQQENGSAVKDSRTAVHQNVVPEKQSSATSNSPNTLKYPRQGLCTVNRTQVATKTVNVERPPVAPVNISKSSPNIVSQDKSLLKRSSQETIDLDCHEFIPNKVPKVLNPVREKKNGIRVTQREPVNRSAASPPRTAVRVPTKSSSTLHPENIGPCVAPRAMHERKNSIPDLSKSIPRRVSETKSIPRDPAVAVKQEPGEVGVKCTAAPSSVSSPAAGRVRTPPISLREDNVANHSFSAPGTFPTPVLSNCTDSKMSVWEAVGPADRAGGGGQVAEPEGFPVISSVFSLSQQPEHAQGSIQPLVMALRGMVMDNSNDPVNTSQEESKMTSGAALVKATQTSGPCALLVPKNEDLAGNPSLVVQTSEHVKVEDSFNAVQCPSALTHICTHIKEEQSNASVKDETECSGIADSKPPKNWEAVSETEERADASTVSDEHLQPAEKSENDVSSKFLTVSLKRVQVGVWKKKKKGVKLRISKYKTQVPIARLRDRAVIYPMPLKEDQPVKRPGPNQPVVVLNHPQPRVPVQGTPTDTLPDAEAPQVVPKCQILKMRLSKVMGQKYEVMGCTVGVFP